MAGQEGAAGAQKRAPLARRRGLSAVRLASALGLTPLVRSFSATNGRSAGVGGNAALLASARRRVGGIWHSATSAQHVRAILDVRILALVALTFIVPVSESVCNFILSLNVHHKVHVNS